MELLRRFWRANQEREHKLHFTGHWYFLLFCTEVKLVFYGRRKQDTVS